MLAGKEQLGMNTIRRGRPDFLLLFLTFALVGFGLVMVFSASAMTASVKYHNPWYFSERQAVWCIFGLLVMFTFMNIPYTNYIKWFRPFFAFTVILLVLVLMIGTSINGHKSWFGFGSFGIQPTEMAKLSLYMYLAALISKKGERISDFKRGFLPVLIIIGLVVGLIMLQPDIGSSIIILACSFIVAIAGGVRWRHLLIIALCTSPLILYIVTAKSYRVQRFASFLHPWDDTSGSSYQLIQSLYALGHGGWMGAGFGNSVQKLSYLPEAQTDFIFAIVGEELGWLGCTFFIICFLLFLWRGILISVKCEDSFGSLLALAIISSFGIQALINLGGVSGSIPITGVPLPLISYGGSSLMISMASIGMLLSMSRHQYLNRSNIPGEISGQ